MSMDQPPVCSYEGSDYQASFWDLGGRQYEDAVEAVALRRLLPKSGKRLLELGAGAGRNTPRYSGFDEVVLVDYSRTQLEQAVARLGTGRRYRFVAADVYHLPFVPGLFDAATMIRTLHHMAGPQQALQQAANCLQTGAAFILEFANKRNLKAMLRYAVGRQKWSPYSLQPVEFAALNFNFHPAAVRSWLRNCGFTIQKQLTVSHFRLGTLKRRLPLRLLVAVDSLLQPSGNLFQVSPSVFVHSLAGRNDNAQAGVFFACPACGAPLEDTPPRLNCSCGRSYPVQDGIYDLRLT
jgi:ubiquinone/menaquinone biosynthesis C-methylase UbiE